MEGKKKLEDKKMEKKENSLGDVERELQEADLLSARTDDAEPYSLSQFWGPSITIACC